MNADWLLPEQLKHAGNSDIAAFLERQRPSAHDEVASELKYALEGLPGVRTFCPDVHAYAYVVAYDKEGHIFALACGQAQIGVRIGKANLLAASKDGAQPAGEIGEDWVWFKLFATSEPAAWRSRLARWCRAAHQSA